MTHTVSLTSSQPFDAYIAEPVGPPKGAVIVIHEIWGLVDHIRGIADRFAAEGYLAIAPDLLSHIGIDAELGLELQGIMFATDEKVRSDGQPRLRAALAPLQAPEFAEWAVASLRATVDHVAGADGVDGRIAVVGFCFGGTYSFALAAADDRIRAAVPYYGEGPTEQQVQAIGCPVLALYGGTDERLMQALPAAVESAEQAGMDLETHVWPQAGHAFFNDTNAFTYDAEVASDAWRRTLAFLEQKL